MKNIKRHVVEIIFYASLSLAGMYLYWHFGLGMEMSNPLLLYCLILVALVIQKLFAAKVTVPLFDKEYRSFQGQQDRVEETLKEINGMLREIKELNIIIVNETEINKLKKGENDE